VSWDLQRIEVREIKVYGYHGCLAEEERIGGNYIVDLFVDADVSTSFETDHLVDTVDYVLLNRIVKEEMAVRSKLIEQVAHRIHTRIKKSDSRIKKAGVCVRKISPPINGDVAEVTFRLEG
jgi:dihydroneopterin aldolase